LLLLFRQLSLRYYEVARYAMLLARARYADDDAADAIRHAPDAIFC